MSHSYISISAGRTRGLWPLLLFSLFSLPLAPLSPLFFSLPSLLLSYLLSPLFFLPVFTSLLSLLLSYLLLFSLLCSLFLAYLHLPPPSLFPFVSSLFSLLSALFLASSPSSSLSSLLFSCAIISSIVTCPIFPLLKLKAEFQEEEHASSTPTESIICPCLTMSPVSHSHSASPPTQPSNLFTLKSFPNLHRAIGGRHAREPRRISPRWSFPTPQPHQRSTTSILIHSFIYCKINLLNFQVDGVLLASE